MGKGSCTPPHTHTCLPSNAHLYKWYRQQIALVSKFFMLIAFFIFLTPPPPPTTIRHFSDCVEFNLKNILKPLMEIYFCRVHIRTFYLSFLHSMVTFFSTCTFWAHSEMRSQYSPSGSPVLYSLSMSPRATKPLLPLQTKSLVYLLIKVSLSVLLHSALYCMCEQKTAHYKVSSMLYCTMCRDTISVQSSHCLHIRTLYNLT